MNKKEEELFIKLYMFYVILLYSLNWYDCGNVRPRGRPQIGWTDDFRVHQIISRPCSGLTLLTEAPSDDDTSPYFPWSQMIKLLPLYGHLTPFTRSCSCSGFRFSLMPSVSTNMLCSSCLKRIRGVSAVICRLIIFVL